MARIELKDVCLRFQLRRGLAVSLKEMVIKGLFLADKSKRFTSVDALNNVNFTLTDGQRLAIVGHNGAGKSTLLRLLAGVYVPTSGTRTVDGRVSSMLDIGVGIEPDSSGRENILFRGYLQRQTPAELRRRAPEIAEFSELGEFLDVPVRCYSSGMMVRLAFSIATSIEPEILLIDEIFSAGDAGFQKKAADRMTNLMSKARIIVMASHDVATLRSLCNIAIWMDHGRVRMMGDAKEVIDAYSEAMAPRQSMAA
jgi:ABC-type polysaccharide/polyol phosphate transport system ATPase subunit